ncbi:MAG: DUF3551 domain-containing protein [Variibacter sp.]
MRYAVSIAAIAAASVFHAPGAARADPWCAYYDAYTYTCGFTSFRQCLATVSGTGGDCRPDYRALEERRPRADERRRHRRSRD